jgi:hypothetical protein
MDIRDPRPKGDIRGASLATKSPDDAGAFELGNVEKDQYFATTGPPKR